MRIDLTRRYRPSFGAKPAAIPILGMSAIAAIAIGIIYTVIIRYPANLLWYFLTLSFHDPQSPLHTCFFSAILSVLSGILLFLLPFLAGISCLYYPARFLQSHALVRPPWLAYTLCVPILLLAYLSTWLTYAHTYIGWPTSLLSPSVYLHHLHDIYLFAQINPPSDAPFSHGFFIPTAIIEAAMFLLVPILTLARSQTPFIGRRYCPICVAWQPLFSLDWTLALPGDFSQLSAQIKSGDLTALPSATIVHEFPLNSPDPDPELQKLMTPQPDITNMHTFRISICRCTGCQQFNTLSISTPARLGSLTRHTPLLQDVLIDKTQADILEAPYINDPNAPLISI